MGGFFSFASNTGAGLVRLSNCALKTYTSSRDAGLFGGSQVCVTVRWALPPRDCP